MDTGTPLTIPAFYCPIPPANRPDAATIERKALRWITEMGAFADRRRLTALATAQAGIVIPQAMPEALPDRVQIAADFMYWGFTFDDSHFEEGPWAIGPQRPVNSWVPWPASPKRPPPRCCTTTPGPARCATYAGASRPVRHPNRPSAG
ncbi:hypothetical protein [Streptomyces sp. CA-132043]|uniref:hypothetical protein n=1 Tax=Streptomyces sp. CA-132043 TaxID=3240048 RepID=UPI003D933CE7